MGTDGSWPASRSARSHPGRATLAWTATRHSASVRGGLPETKAVSANTRVLRSSTSGTSSSNTARALGVPFGGERRHARVSRPAPRRTTCAAESRASAARTASSKNLVRMAMRPLSPSPRARTRARVSSPASAAAKGSTKSGGGSSRSDSSARSAAMDLAESVTARGSSFDDRDDESPRRPRRSRAKSARTNAGAANETTRIRTSTGRRARGEVCAHPDQDPRS